MNQSTLTLCTVVSLLALLTLSTDGTRPGQAPVTRAAGHVPGFSLPSKITVLLAASSSPDPVRPAVDWSMAAASQSSDLNPMSKAAPPCLRAALSVSLASSPTVLYGLVSPRARLALSADVLPSGADVLHRLFGNAARTPSKNRKIETGAPDPFAPRAGPVDILDPVSVKNTEIEKEPSVLHATPTPESAKQLKPLFRPIFAPVGF